MLNLLKVEFYKLRSFKPLYIVIVLMILQSIGIYMVSNPYKNLTGKAMIYFSFGNQMFLLLIPIIGAFSYFIVDEFTTGSIKNLVSYGHRRANIVISKSIAFYVGIILISMAFPISATVISTILNGYGEAFTLSSFMYILRVTSLMMLICIGIGSIGVLLAFLSRNIVITVAAFMCIDPINRAAMFFSVRNEAVEAVYEKTIFGQLKIALLDSISFSQGAQIVVISLLTIMISIFISMIVFKRTDIK